MTTLDLVLILLVCFQQVYWTIQTQRLVNKIMSRDFTEYASNLKAVKPNKTEAKLPVDEPEDLRRLQEFSLMP